jgi:hypothetical protein
MSQIDYLKEKIEQFGEINEDNIYEFIYRYFPNGLNSETLSYIRRITSIQVQTEYASIRNIKVPSLQEYINILWEVSQNHAMFVLGCFYVLFSHVAKREEFLSFEFIGQRTFNGLIIPDWFYATLEKQKQIQEENNYKYYLFVEGKYREIRVVVTNDVTLLNSSMAARTGFIPAEYNSYRWAWGRTVAVFQYSSIDINLTNDRIDSHIGRLAVYNRDTPVLVIDKIDNVFLCYDGKELFLCSRYTISSISKNAKTELRKFVDKNLFIDREMANELRNKWLENQHEPICNVGTCREN